MIGMVQTNIAAAKLEEFFMIEKASALDNFFGLIFTTVPKLLAIISTTV